MSRKAKSDRAVIESTGGADLVGGLGSEPGGRAQQPVGGASPGGGLGLPREVRDRLSDEVIDELLAGAFTVEEIGGPGGLLGQLTKRLVERALGAELTGYLGYEPHQEPPGGVGYTRKGATPKTLVTGHGPVEIETPRDRKRRSSRSWLGRASGASRGLTR
jgi:Transposase, Mutator family